ncbi:sensor histidine kinase [Celerinatantimonas diazotrophica]|uniref:histidine kinase n=1 Tax=Celerinatantimonas diazotrophica TaxID=412034 RepID=A0A4R1J9C7_9GAMM|nr:sensor histidine kinase [Celerinatantimonas diazotrophica]TCK47110.1 histidine kinase/DNA gyrase B/HSP90-like ATPase [Celerinatantimonas diazotrophica]CAG9295879.1 Adaptive-response sensory-kinase SasA [Celerinatantimonas diazotrophica]
MRTFYRFITVFFALLISWDAYSQSIAIQAGINTVHLTQNIQYLTDKTGQLTLKDILKREGDFTSVAFPFGAGFSNNAYWFRFTLQRGQGAAKDWLLTISPTYLDSVKLYTPLGHQHYSQSEVGDLLPAERSNDSATRSSSEPSFMQSIMVPFSLPITLTDTQPHTFYIRLQTNSSTTLQLTLQTPAQAAYTSTSKKIISAIATGGWLMLCLYAFIMTRLTQKKAYVLSCIYLLGCIAHTLVRSSIAAQYIFPDHPMLVNLLAPTSVCLMLSGIILFFMSFFQTSQKFKYIHWFLRLNLGLNLASFISLFFGKYTLFAPFMFQVSYVTFPVLCFVIWRGVKNGIAGSRSLFLGYVVFFILNISAIFASTYRLSTPSVFLDMPEITSFIFIVMMYQGLYQHKQAEDVTKRKLEEKIHFAEKEVELEKTRRINQSNFMTLITHELKTPLAVIDSIIQTLPIEKIDISPQLAERHSRIQTAISQLNLLIDNTLISEHMDLENTSPNCHETNIYEIIKNIINRLPSDTKKHIINTVSIFKLNIDPFLFQLVLNNLLINALKYRAPESSISITSTKNCEKNKEGVLISICNDYQSSHKPDPDQWFNKYYRQLEKPSIQGFGLGLYLVKGIVEAHSGQIQCRVMGNAPIWKITFSVWFPSTGKTE